MPSRLRGRPAARLNASRIRLAEVNERFAKRTQRKMLVLDAGAGHGPYRRLFKHARYEAADIATLPQNYTPLDYVCSLDDIPVEDNRYDRILFNQVLEHIAAPADVLAELHRLLKPGGRILCTCPLFYEEHQKPYDYYRYTRFALVKLFEEAGFEDVTVTWLEGYLGTVSYQFDQMSRWLPRRARMDRHGWRALYLTPIFFVIQTLSRPLANLFARTDLEWKIDDRGMPKNYVVRARKARAPQL